MKERLLVIPNQDVESKLKKIEAIGSYSDLIAAELEQTVFDQPVAMKAIARRLALSESGTNDPTKPLGSMFFLGPSGVGKTEASHAAARYMFGDANSDRLKIINMAEMQEDHYITRFVGSPPSYVGYAEKPLIPHNWLHAGRSIVVLDEFDKAAPAIKQLFLGVLDKGKMDARAGQRGNEALDFRDSVLIFTSNIAGQEIHRITEGRRLGFGDREQSSTVKGKEIANAATEGMKKALSPEFINRLDDVVVFKEIEDREVYAKMLKKFVNERNDYVIATHPNPFQYAVSEAFQEYALDKVGKKGGRELKRILDRELFDRAADIIMGLDMSNKPIVAHRQDEKTVFYTDDNPPVEIKQITSGEKKSEGGEAPIPSDWEGWDDEYREPEPVFSEEDTGEEDIKKPKKKKPKATLNFMMPLKPGATMDIAISINDNDRYYGQVIEGIPLPRIDK